MDDKQLLELAAKAAGYLISPSPLGNCLIAEPGRGQRVWNPLLLDGDAFRLVCRLRLAVDVDESSATVTAVIVQGIVSCSEPAERDIEAATRRAIVRAVAEIGRAAP